MEHPAITRAQRTGYPNDPAWPICPICGKECETVYRDSYGDIFGCDECVSSHNAWDTEECFEEE